MKMFSELPIGAHFRFAGYDDLFLKLSATTAKCEGCPVVKGKFIRLARAGQTLHLTDLTDLCETL